MSLLRTMSLTQRTFTPGTREKGSWVEGKPEDDVHFKGTVQPASGKMLELLPSGKRTNETVLVFAPIELEFTAADSLAQRSGDIIIWEDRLYEVQVVKKWSAGLIPHWELLASRVKEGEK